MFASMKQYGLCFCFHCLNSDTVNIREINISELAKNRAWDVWPEPDFNKLACLVSVLEIESESLILINLYPTYIQTVVKNSNYKGACDNVSFRNIVWVVKRNSILSSKVTFQLNTTMTEGRVCVAVSVLGQSSSDLVRFPTAHFLLHYSPFTFFEKKTFGNHLFFSIQLSLGGMAVWKTQFLLWLYQQSGSLW